MDFHPIGFGGLTNEGKFGEYQLGQYLRKYYSKFLDDLYTEEELEARSTDVLRTKMSAQLVLAGLYPPTKEQRWHPEISWQPIPVYFKKAEEEDVMNPSVCDYRIDALKNIPLDEDVQDLYIKPYLKLFKFIESHSGMEINTLQDLLEFYFIINTESDMNMTLPDWTQEIYPEPLYSAASQVYNYLNYDPNVRRINIGYLLKKIITDCHMKVLSTISDKYPAMAKRKLYLYSGHESTLGYFLQSMDLSRAHIPSYGAAIMVELRKDEDDNYYIKILYRNKASETDPKILTIPECGTLCPLDLFISLQNAILPTVSIQEACKLSK